MVNREKGNIIYRENDDGEKENSRNMYLLREGNVRRFHIQSETGKEVSVGFYFPRRYFRIYFNSE